jgi:hypothetical protein
MSLGKPQIPAPPYQRFSAWFFFEIGIKLLEMLGIPTVAVGLNRLFKRNTRPLTYEEIALARTVFGNSIQYERVYIDARSYFGCKKYQFAYVGFNCINSWGELSAPHFIHEMTHIWQFQHLGALYIPRALHAQGTREGYHYGGIEKLKQAQSLLEFNFEQQGDIVADYFCIKTGLIPKYCSPDLTHLPVFERVIYSAVQLR